MIDDFTIQKILYGAIRNEKHLKVRKKGYLRSSLRLVFDLIFIRPKKIGNYSLIILNLLSDKLLDLKHAELPETVLYGKMNIKNHYFRKLYIIELGLNFCFLINNQFFHRLVFKHLEDYGNNYISKSNLVGIICGPSTLLTTFLGVLLNSRNRPVIIVQHGIYQLSSFDVEWYEKFVMSKVLVWGELYRELYVNQGVLPSKMEVVAPYFKNYFLMNDRIELDEFNSSKILFIGQQLNKISENFFEPYNSFLDRLIIYYERLGKKIVYKAHPRELINDTLSVKNLNRLDFFSSEADVNNFEIFYSVSSTLLVEMYLKKKICYQVNIDISNLTYDNFNLYTGIPFVQKEDLEGHINLKEYKFWIDSKYLNFWDDYKVRMANKIKSLLFEPNEPSINS